MVVEFTSSPLMKCSFLGVNVYAQIQGSGASNNSRDCYNTYLDMRSLGRFDRSRRRDAVTGVCTLSVTRGGARGRGSKKSMCDAGIQFPFELLVIYFGAWMTTFVPHHLEPELYLHGIDSASGRPLKEMYPEGIR